MTETGHDVISSYAPKEIDEIEELMAASKLREDTKVLYRLDTKIISDSDNLTASSPRIRISA